MRNARADGRGLQSVDRAVTVLEVLATRGEAGVSEVGAALGVHKSSAFRLLGASEDRGLVEQMALLRWKRASRLLAVEALFRWQGRVR
jgi:DNA-binding IclR family transcriptional regulator